MQQFRFARLALLAIGLVCLQAGAQEQSTPTTGGPAIPIDEFDRGTPRRSEAGFLAAAGMSDYETAAEYLDLRNLRGEASQLTGAQLANRLYVVFERASWVDVEDLVDDPAGRSNDNLPAYRDSIGVIRHEGQEIQLLMQRVPRGDGVYIWKISNATVSAIPNFYETYGYPETIENLRRYLPNVAFLGYELFKWVIVLATIPLAYGAVFLIALVIRWMLGDPDLHSHRQVFRFLVMPFGIWVVTMAVNAVATTLGRGAAAEAWHRVSPVSILLTVWVMFVGVNLIRNIYSRHLDARDRAGSLVFLRPAGQAIKVVIVVGAAVVYMDKLGINITTILAGLGVGGIAVALALQKPMEDVFAAITLYTQQPIRIGDFCRIGDHTGTVEEIGLRTTRLRTLGNTLIAVPNSRLATEPIDNISAREKIWYRPILRLRYDTTPEQLRSILAGIRDLLASHEWVLPETQRVRFMQFADDALLVEVYAYLATTDWAEYLELAEELHIGILEIVARAGTSLSLPASRLHVEQFAAPER